MKTPMRFWILLALFAMSAAAEKPGFKVTKKYPIPGDGAFNYIVFDSPSNRLYVSHGTEVDVLDADSGKLLGKIQNTPGVHGIAIVARLHRGFTTSSALPWVREKFNSRACVCATVLRVPRIVSTPSTASATKLTADSFFISPPESDFVVASLSVRTSSRVR